jgi:hypothetical protein
MNVIDFEGKKVLVQPNIADKGKDKEIIGNEERPMGIIKFLVGKWWPRRLPMEERLLR